MNGGFLKGLWGSWGERQHSQPNLSQAADVTADAKGALILAERLVSHDGDVSKIAIASQLITTFESMAIEEQRRFFQGLVKEFGPDKEALEKAIATYQQEPVEANAVALHEAAEPKRQELIRRMNMAPMGTAGVVNMRKALLRFLRERPELKPVDNDFSHLLSSWFNRGFLQLKPVDWHTPASVLEKIVQYEAVHEISDWEELRRRIGLPDRRCYAFFHPTMPEEPLIFVEVALLQGLPSRIDRILASDRDACDPLQASTAVFYSISNCQRGLRGITFGNFIIKQVVENLAAELPNLKTFITLSPVPGLRRWIGRQAEQKVHGVESRLARVLDTEGWLGDVELNEVTKLELMPAAAHYFLNVKGRGGLPLDPVARFHLGNGARLERIHWQADPSEKGRRQSGAIMVSYLYSRPHIEQNHEAFANAGEVVVSPEVLELAKQYPQENT